MVYRGKVHNKQIELEGGVCLPEGTVVVVEPVESAGREAGEVSLLEYLGDLVGSVEGAPADLAEQHDHYAHGAPRQ